MPGTARDPSVPAVPSVVSHAVTPWTVARQPPLSTGFSRQEHRSGSPCPPPRGIFPTQDGGPSVRSPASAAGFFTNSAVWGAHAPNKQSAFSAPAEYSYLSERYPGLQSALPPSGLPAASLVFPLTPWPPDPTNVSPGRAVPSLDLLCRRLSPVAPTRPRPPG